MATTPRNKATGISGSPCCTYPALDTLQGSFTDRLKEVLRQAAETCDEFAHERLLPDDLWLGLFRASKGVGLTTLERCGIALGGLRKAIEGGAQRSEARKSRPCRHWSSACLFIITTAMKRSEEADAHLHGYVGTEHLVWALLEADATGSQWVRDHGIDAKAFGQECLASLRESAEEWEKQQRALLDSVRSGDEKARRELLESSLEFASNFARSMARERGCSVDNLMAKAKELAGTAIDTFKGETDKEWWEHFGSVLDAGFHGLTGENGKKSGLVANGQHRARCANLDRVRAEVEQHYAQALAEAGWWARLRLRLRIRREIERRMKELAPHDALYLNRR